MINQVTFYKFFIEIIRVFFILLLVYAAITKLLDFEKFQIQLGQFPYISQFAGVIALAVPILEILIALLFFPYKYTIVGFYASLVLMLMFTGYIVAVLSFSTTIPCSCGGVIATFSWKEHLTFNIACAVIALFGIWFWRNKEKYLRENNNEIFVATKAGEAENLNNRVG